MCINGFLELLYYSKVVNEFAELKAISQFCPSSSETMNVHKLYWNILIVNEMKRHHSIFLRLV